jgi:hypothetical protein
MEREEEVKVENKEENIVRITITKDADNEADKIVASVNDGFDGGRVSKQDVASWVLMNFAGLAGADFVQRIRSEFFNELVRFKNLLKQAQQSGGITPEIRQALKSLSDDAGKPKNEKKRLKKSHIIDMNQSKDEL